MMMNIVILVTLCAVVQAQEYDKTVHVHAQRVFKHAFNPSMFKWKNGDFGGINRFTYSYLPALKGLPDMPAWMKYKYSQRHSAGKYSGFQ